MDLNKLDLKKNLVYHEVSAGGVVIVRKDNTIAVVVIERAAVHDISLPKGHRNEGESLQETAMREIKEETGYTAEVTHYLGDFTYLVKNGEASYAMRNVHWFLMEAVNYDPIVRNEEVKKVRLMDINSDFSDLTYDNDRDFINRAKEYLNL